MGDFFLVVRIFYRKPLETDNGIRLFSSIIRDERYFFSVQDIFHQVFPCKIFFPSKSACRIIFFLKSPIPHLKRQMFGPLLFIILS